MEMKFLKDYSYSNTGALTTHALEGETLEVADKYIEYFEKEGIARKPTCADAEEEANEVSSEEPKLELKLGDTWECEHDDGPYTHTVTGFEESGEAIIEQTKKEENTAPEEPDDLTEVFKITDVTAELLNDKGITTYAGLLEMAYTPEGKAWLVEQYGINKNNYARLLDHLSTLV